MRLRSLSILDGIAPRAPQSDTVGLKLVLGDSFFWTRNEGPRTESRQRHHSTAVGRNCHNVHYHDDCTKTNCSLLSRHNKLHNCHKKQDLDNCDGRQKYERSAKQTLQQLTQKSFHDKDEALQILLTVQKKNQTTTVHVFFIAGDTEGLPRQCHLCRHTIDTIEATKAHKPSTHGNPSGCSPSILSTRSRTSGSFRAKIYFRCRNRQ